ncbi:sigma-70 family RNA polymerase sigma factor [Variovorax sp. KK3]|uniref:sigma-70 family RNA polymerase sigma factor n=1 Tax=Variovorax sp. KK3 TaxID=1855728 RepID=UPI00097C2157|nr:sigma-70 family RNA polymerase sigma factor [Variovorax sp. KK3]
MRTARQPAITSARPLASATPWLSIVTKEQPRGFVPSSEELNTWLRAVALAADRQAFAALFKHFAPRVKAYLMLRGASEPLAEELTQEAMVSVWRKAATFDPARAGASTWIFTIARNLRVDHLRRQGNHLLSDDDEQASQMLDPLPALDDQVLAREREARVRKAMSRLSEEQAQILRLSFFEEHPHAQIAQELGLPLGTVKSRARLAISHLRRLLEGLES